MFGLRPERNSMSRMNREYKSSIFTLLFSDKEKLMSLFSAISGEQIDSPDEITINTLTDENGYTNEYTIVGIYLIHGEDVYRIDNPERLDELETLFDSAK